MPERDIVTEDFEFRVVRKVVKVAPAMLENYQLELFMDDLGFKAGPDTEGRYTWSGPEPEVTGFWFYPYNDEYSETHRAKFGDYIIINGYKDAYVLTAAEFEAENPTAVSAK